MTREEKEDAIDIIQLILDRYEEDECLVTEMTIGDEDIKAFKMAIKALEQEPCGDYISREDAIMCMTGEYVADMTYKPEDIISKHIQRLRALPPVTPQEPAIDKIKSIVAEWKKDTWTDNLSYECMIKIAEIIDKSESEEEHEQGN